MSGRLNGQSLVLYDNGAEFLFVDGACDYWVLPLAGSNEKGIWSEVRTGRLTDSQLGRFNDTLMEQDWDSVAAETSSGSGVDHPGDLFLWRDRHVGYCPSPCGGKVGDLGGKAQELTLELYAAGAPLPLETPLRWTVVERNDLPQDAFIFTNWTGTSLSEVDVPSEDLVDLSYGNHALVPSTDVASLRTILERYRAYPGSIAFLALLDGNTPYAASVRTTLPFEDARGLVRPPGALSVAPADE